jgi:hypothetical protein
MGINRKGVLVLLAGALSSSAAAQWSGWDYTFDREIKPWQELQLQLPPYPKSETLIAFDAGAATSHHFFLDEKSISLGEDGVVRYTLVIKTSGGAMNVTFEGIRCETREKKTYALGHSDGTWARARNPDWRFIERRLYDRHYNVLYGDIFCRGKLPMETVKDMTQALRQGAERVRN